jgi:hypothetical protein
VAQHPTCGQGVAEHSAFPARFADLLATMAENLEVHLGTLDPQDQTTQPERDAYTRLARETRKLAGELSALAAEMAGDRDLPMGRHDPAALSSRPVVEAFARFLKVEQELCALLEKSVKRGEQMLAQAQTAPEASRH